MPPIPRKILQTGKRSMAVVIPAVMVRALNLKPKQKLYFRLNGAKIIITLKPWKNVNQKLKWATRRMKLYDMILVHSKHHQNAG